MLQQLKSVQILLKPNSKYSLLRNYSTSHGKPSTGNAVRVRFAPSPTGFLHLGGLRTALYNYLFARANHGKFIVRIEDTDQTRIVANAQENLFRSLEWAGITPDESVLHGGEFGPYVQSQRLELYSHHLSTLIESGHAYYCFCTERRLDLLRRDAMRSNEIPKYDNRCRHLPPDKIAEKLSNNDPRVVRFKLDDSDVRFNDIICGQKSFSMQSEGDFVIIKSDGFPTYHFANVVDDHLMQITHVLRGIEWQISTPKHLAMYRAFNWDPPLYAHLPLILNTSGMKLSKRHDDANVDYYKKLDIFPQALVNYITLNGGGFDWSEAPRKSHSMEELIKAFDVSKVHSYPSRLQQSELEECNSLEIQRQVNDPLLIDGLVAKAKRLIQNSFPENINSLDLSEAHIRKALKFASENLHNLQQLVEGDPAFLWLLPDLNEDYVQPKWMNGLISELKGCEFKKTSLVATMKTFAKKEGINFGKMMRTLRTLLSNRKDGYQIAEMLEILGKDASIQRLSRTRPTNNSQLEKVN